jgi:hypothetical protein
LFAKDTRYALPAMIPLLGLCTICVITVSRWLSRRLRLQRANGRKMTSIVFLVLLVYQAYLATQQPVPSVNGYRELVSFLQRVAPNESLFYDGYHDGIFTFYVRAGDEKFQRRVVLGSKLLYASAIVPGWRQQDFVASPEEVTRMLQERGGCRWLAIEISRKDHNVLPMRYLREAVNTSAFELVKSFPIDAPMIERVDVYRFKLPVAEVREVELPFPRLGPGVKFRVRPISPRPTG